MLTHTIPHVLLKNYRSVRTYRVERLMIEQAHLSINQAYRMQRRWDDACSPDASVLVAVGGGSIHDYVLTAFASQLPKLAVEQISPLLVLLHCSNKCELLTSETKQQMWIINQRDQTLGKIYGDERDRGSGEKHTVSSGLICRDVVAWRSK